MTSADESTLKNAASSVMSFLAVYDAVRNDGDPATVQEWAEDEGLEDWEDWEASDFLDYYLNHCILDVEVLEDPTGQHDQHVRLTITLGGPSVYIVRDWAGDRVSAYSMSGHVDLHHYGLTAFIDGVLDVLVMGY